MKKNILTIILIFLLLFCLSACSFFSSGRKESSEYEDGQIKNTITVQGAASITVAPTIAYVSVGVTTFNKDAVIAQSDNAQKMEQVFNALDDLGISRDKIKTTSYSISARYDYTEYTSKLVGYDVTNGIMVTVTDLTKVSQVLDMTVKQGVNQANSISFGITDQENRQFYLQALAEAQTNARSKADALAAAAGIRSIKPLQITEGSPVYVVPVRYDVSDEEKSGDPVTPISGGELKVGASVTVIYTY